MKKPWHIWTLFALCLMVVVPTMLWLSHEALELDRIREIDREQTELARREAELQERINSAMWRMDGFLTSLIAKEATRPWYLYQSFYDIAPIGPPPNNHQPQETRLTSGGQYRQASPLLLQQSEFVVLHFQIGKNNQITSPQTPHGKELLQAVSCGITGSEVEAYIARVKEVSGVCDYDSMLFQCSSMMLPEISLSAPRQTLNAVTMGDQTNAQTSSPSQQQQKSQQSEMTQTDSQVADIESGFEIYGWQNENPQDFGPQGKPIGKKQMVQQSRNMNRGSVEYNMRRKSTDQYAMNEWANNALLEPQMAGAIAASSKVREGVMQPLWIDDRLFLARRVTMENEQVIQCCWLNWDKIEAALQEEVDDILPHLQFQPIRQDDPVRWGQALANLPVQLVIDRDEMISKLDMLESDDSLLAPKRSGIRMSLILAWSGLAFAAIAGAFLLQGVLKLSERRGAFVSAVSHELRTPLTTFRMYAEMLAGKMVPPERQQKYAETLKVEAERLSHLVENVLQFARLERSSQKTRFENTPLGELLDRFTDRLEGRAERSAMQLEISIPNHVLKQLVNTDPAAIEQILFNLVDNACKYARNAEDRRIELSGDIVANQLQLVVQDFGPGVNKQDQKRMFRAFRKSDQDSADTAQGVGLGLALCRRMARSLGGSLTLGQSSVGAKMQLSIPIE